jgi:hypothetical protein
MEGMRMRNWCLFPLFAMALVVSAVLVVTLTPSDHAYT